MAGGLAALTSARTGRAAEPAVLGRSGERELGSLVSSALDGWAPILRVAGRPARLDWRAGRVDLPGDAGAVASVLGNLVANAAEHGSGAVDVHGSRVPGGVRVEVRNELRPQRQHGRRGRGLKIATAAAERAGGQIAIERTGREMRAILELPIDVSTAFESWPARRPAVARRERAPSSTGPDAA